MHELVNVDENDNGPVLNSITITDVEDLDNDNHYEEWYFEIDIDNKTNIQLEEVSVVVYYEGTEKYRSAKFAVNGISTNDKVKLGPFNYADYSGGPAELNFYIVAEHNYGFAEQSFAVPVDDKIDSQLVEPYIESISAVNTTDVDNNGYFEQWSFKIDVDAVYQNDIASEVYLKIEEPVILQLDTTIGPYTFTGYTESDAIVIGSLILKILMSYLIILILYLLYQITTGLRKAG
ncbi:MAG: hypothetical protein HC906_16355 [Bacteroidales bacterium]|nr:hypothetical protein [Bacteroidales bacterium]